MEQWITHKEFKGSGLSGYVSIPVGAKLWEDKGYLFYKNQKLCISTSENAWCHFHLNTLEGEKRYKMVSALEAYVMDGGEIDYPEDYLISSYNHYWKSLIRTAPDDLLAILYQKYIFQGGKK